MILPILYALFFAIDATNDEPTSPDLFGNTLNREDDTTDDYFEQLALGALFDEHGQVMRTFGEYEDTDFDIGPLNELSDYGNSGIKIFRNGEQWTNINVSSLTNPILQILRTDVNSVVKVGKNVDFRLGQFVLNVKLQLE